MPNLRTSVILLLLLAVQFSFWTPGLSYEQLLTLSGYLAINFMSITMALATRPGWLESPLGGLDSMYQLHKWTGILAVVSALAHWLIEMADDGLEALFGTDRSLREADFSGLLDRLQGGAEDLGEPGLYLLLFVVAITLIRWVPYCYWRYLHRAMPLIYLALAAHAMLLAPLKWWQQPTGWLADGTVDRGWCHREPAITDRTNRQESSLQGTGPGRQADLSQHHGGHL